MDSTGISSFLVLAILWLNATKLLVSIKSTAYLCRYQRIYLFSRAGSSQVALKMFTAHWRTSSWQQAWPETDIKPVLTSCFSSDGHRVSLHCFDAGWGNCKRTPVRPLCPDTSQSHSGLLNTHKTDKGNQWRKWDEKMRLAAFSDTLSSAGKYGQERKGPVVCSNSHIIISRL